MSWETDLERLRSQTSIKWTHYEPDVIPAWVADMDLLPAPPILEAVRALLDRGDLGYNFAAWRRIPEVFAARQETRFGWRPDVESVRLFCDVMQVVELALWLHTEPGDGVVLLTPVYHPFYTAIEACGGRRVELPLDAGTWRLDADRLEAAVDSGTRAILTCNPHNPMGRAFSRDELVAVAEVAERHDLLVISDEIWSDLTYPGVTHVPFASISPAAASRTVTVAAASKAFNLAGMRCAVAHVGHAGIAEQLAALPGHVLGAVSSLGAEATLAAWTHGDAWLAETLTLLESNRDHLARRLAAELPAVGFLPPEATYLAWLDFSAYELGEDPAKVLLREARVGLSSGRDFGAGGAGYARLNFATTRPILDQIIDRIVSVCGPRTPQG
jgi:cystathionine beta-lyase